MGYDDGLMLDYEGYLAETSVSNVFFVIDSVLYTPIADRFLNGLTRQTVIFLARSLGIKVVEDRLLPDILSKVQEVFLTGTAAEVTPVICIDNYKYPELGEVTKLVMNAFNEYVIANCA
jgi:branched-subunit amino acid aminotransferase/4-amino-4-deoxychorismate lyase